MQVLNALLLACSGQVGSDALSSMAQLLQQGAVCDTWAPNGSSVRLVGRLIVLQLSAAPRDLLSSGALGTGICLPGQCPCTSGSVMTLAGCP